MVFRKMVHNEQERQRKKTRIYYKLSNLKEKEREKRRDNNKTLQERERIEEIVSKIMRIKEKES